MPLFPFKPCFALGLSLFVAAGLDAATPLTVSVAAPAPPSTEGFKMGAARHPDGTTISLDNSSLRWNGQPWTPVMGEFHYARYPTNEWRQELLKMKAGGIDVVATYVFWIHHEEVEGQWDWSGCRDLRQFVQLAGEVGLKAIVRCGPWCHGEVRNGGHPDWLLQKGWRVRSDDTNYLAKVKILYGQIAGQLRGLLWKEGGPVVGIQFENEYGGPAQHLLTLKQIGRDAGLDVPLYTRTGWPRLSTPMPFGEIAPLYGVYAEGFWDRELTPMPGQYWAGFHFSTLRTDANIANEVLGRSAKDATDVARYPYLTCEIGAGMMSSYHRRILVEPADAEATTLVKLGSGSTSPGYYMYHGGVNPDGKLTTLMESQATGMWNDMPVKNYDFQTALGQYGQVRPQYHLLRRLHCFLHDYGSDLAGMAVALPDQRPTGRDDVTTLRWAARSDGKSGFIFVNNYERGRLLPEKTGVQFAIKLADGQTMQFPAKPAAVASGAMFLWPFNLELHGTMISYATAMPFSHILENNGTRTIFLAATRGVPFELALATNTVSQVETTGAITRDGGTMRITGVQPSRAAAVRLTSKSGERQQFVLLDEADSLAFWKGPFAGRNRAVITRSDVVFDRDELRLSSVDRDNLQIAVFPAPGSVTASRKELGGKADGIFTQFVPTAPSSESPKASFERLQAAGSPREIPLGKIRQAVAAAPEDSDFEKAAVWRIKLPAEVDLNHDPLLRLHYTGDVARVLINGKMITDDFWNGNALEIGLRRHAPEILNGDLRVAILPLRKGAPIYLPEQAKPDFGGQDSVAELKQVEIVPRYQLQLSAR